MRQLLAFALLVACTAAEVAVAVVPGARAARVTALCGLLMVKAAIVLMLFMRAQPSQRATRLVWAALAVGIGYAVVLMMEAAFRAGVA
jgi:hypothetical protein